jgi:hypothetical protein
VHLAADECVRLARSRVLPGRHHAILNLGADPLEHFARGHSGHRSPRESHRPAEERGRPRGETASNVASDFDQLASAVRRVLLPL